MKRVVQRDIEERGKAKMMAENDFMKSWDLYYRKYKFKYMRKDANEFVIKNGTSVNEILKKIIN